MHQMYVYVSICNHGPLLCAGDTSLLLPLQVNHLGHFLLTLELLPVLQTTARESGDVRVVCVSSLTHSWYNWEPNNMNAETDYSRLKFYPKSTLYKVSAMVLHTTLYAYYTKCCGLFRVMHVLSRAIGEYTANENTGYK